MGNDAVTILLAGGLAGFLIAVAAMLKGWRGWLELKRAELESRDGRAAASPSPKARIELADLKERVRRLEAIANGVEG